MVSSLKNERRKVTVRAPASSANLGPGFDVFGLSLMEPCADVLVEKVGGRDIIIEVLGEGYENVPLNPKDNAAGVVARELSDRFSIRTGLKLKIDSGIPLGVGLGASAASSAATVVALDYMFDLSLSVEEKVMIAAKGEHIASGAGHADNVSAVILGGFILVRSYEPLRVLSIEPPGNLGVCVAVPRLPPRARKTEVARSLIPKEVHLNKAVYNIGHASSLAVGFALKNIEMIGESMSDVMVEPHRSGMIPGYSEVRKRALRAGAAGVAISGAGPSMIALYDSDAVDGKKVMASMTDGFRTAGVESRAMLTRAGKGARVLSNR